MCHMSLSFHNHGQTFTVYYDSHLLYTSVLFVVFTILLREGIIITDYLFMRSLLYIIYN